MTHVPPGGDSRWLSLAFAVLALPVVACSSSHPPGGGIANRYCAPGDPAEGTRCSTGSDYPRGCDATSCSVNGVASGHRYACVEGRVKYSAPSTCSEVCPADLPQHFSGGGVNTDPFVGTCAWPFPAGACAASAAAGVLLTYSALGHGLAAWTRSDRPAPMDCPSSAPKNGDPCGCDYLPDTLCRYDDCSGANLLTDAKCDFGTGLWVTSSRACHDAGP